VLADLEERWPHEVLIVTQNIDDLQERAGFRNLIHMHGEPLRARCTPVRQSTPAERISRSSTCARGGVQPRATRRGLTVAVFALVAAQRDAHAGVSSFDQVISTNSNDRWTGPTPSWRSRSQILKNATLSR